MGRGEIMKTTIVFANEISYETVAELIKQLEEHSDKQINLYFSSAGGGVGAGEVLTDYFNYRGLDLTLISNWSMNSVAFEVFFKSISINKRIMPNTHSVIHFARRDMSSIDLKDKKTYEYFLFEDVKKGNSEYLKFLAKIGISKNDIETVRKGKDVILDYDRLKELL